MDRREVEQQLRNVGERRRAAIAARAAASAELAPLIRAARDAGMTTGEIVEASGVSKQGVYDLLDAAERRARRA